MNRSLTLVALAIGTALLAGCKGGPEPEDVGTASSALAITGLFATGVDSSGNLLPIGTTDPHYVLSGDDPVNMGPDAQVVTPVNNWAAATATSEWISLQASAHGSQTATDDYTLTFSLPATDDPTTATLSGTFFCSRGCQVLLNGQVVQTSVLQPSFTLQTLAVGPAAPFVTGSNTLAFAVTSMNIDPMGLQ